MADESHGASRILVRVGIVVVFVAVLAVLLVLYWVKLQSTSTQFSESQLEKEHCQAMLDSLVVHDLRPEWQSAGIEDHSERAEAETKFLVAIDTLRHGFEDPCIEILKSLAEEYPKVPSFHISQGIAEYMTGHYEDAAKSLMEGVKGEKATPGTLLYLGKALRRSQESLPAIKYFDSSLALDPGNIEAHYLLALELEKIGEDSRARWHRKVVDSLEPGYPDPDKSQPMQHTPSTGE